MFLDEDDVRIGKMIIHNKMLKIDFFTDEEKESITRMCLFGFVKITPDRCIAPTQRLRNYYE
jgi:hypothetical protein